MNGAPEQPLPPYFRLKAALLEDILSGRYGTDGRLPTEHELCAQFGLSRTPVTRALSQLAEEGVVLRHRRRGTFVNPHWLRRHPDRPELRVMVPEGSRAAEVLRAAGDDVAVSVLQVEFHDLHRALTRSIAEGLGPDLAVIDSVWVREFASDGFLLPIDELAPDWVAGEYAADFLEPFVSANRWDGHTYAVQAEADVAGVWYRRDLFDELRLPPPTTWRQLRHAGRRLAESGLVDHPVVLPCGSRGGETTTFCLLALLASNRAAVLDGDAVTLNRPRAVAALRFLRGLVDEGLVPMEAVAYDWDRAHRLLAAGRAGISFGGSYEGARLAATRGATGLDEVAQTFGFLPVPAGPDGGQATLAGGMVYCITRQARHRQTATRLLRRLIEPATLARIAHSTGQIPPRASAVDLVAEDLPFVRLTADLLSSAVTRPATNSYALVSAQLQLMLEGLLTRRHSPAAAADRAADAISAITGLPVLPG